MSHPSRNEPTGRAGTSRAMMRDPALLLAIGGMSAWLSGAQAQFTPAPAAAPAAEVRVDNFTFAPPTLTVATGTTVTWVNADDIPHTVMANDRSFRSKPLDTDDRFSFTFNTPGEYAYFCSLHPHMVGTVIVKPGPSPS